MSIPVNMNVLLLGATGFIGNAVLQSLLASGCRVTALRHTRPIEHKHDHLHVITGSIGSIRLKHMPYVPDIIVHTARNRTGRFGSLGRRLVAWKGKQENIHLLKEVSKLAKPPAIFYCSGSLMYGSHEGILIDESFPVAPVSFARQYIRAEEPFLDAAGTTGIRVIMLRLPWVIGQGSWFQWNYLDLMHQRRYVPLYGDGGNIMSFIDNAVIGDIILELARTDFKGTLNLFHPNYLSQKKWAQMISLLSGLPLKVIEENDRSRFGDAALEAFSTHITLGSKYDSLQKAIRKHHLPLEDILKKYLFPLKHK